MRSILLKNIKFLQDHNFAAGTSVCKTSNHFIKGYLSEHKNKIFL